MFKFGNFDTKLEDEVNEENEAECLMPCLEIELNSRSSYSNENQCTFAIDNLEIQYFNPSTVLQDSSVNDSTIIEAEKNHSDLLEGVYEGGLKIWECTYDVANYLCTRCRNLITDKQVLDLGCGSGILGIIAYKLGASVVHFQDYNEGVIKHLTMPNVAINGDEILNKSKFWSGDWNNFTSINNIKYDIILTSETIYNPKNYKKLLKVFKNFLKPDGIVILGGKSYYFGVGGSMAQFQDIIKEDNKLAYENVWSAEEGIKREIILIRHQLADINSMNNEVNV
ncbi:hypothetical protein O3M35_007270 [Rhynocoris fuscipes]|uniref:protein-histidine N-methyltransferase n=1 Tax=Rhynocoris fuscipes TaxID=488301 RepID=A0AAW1D8S8_9HEMI